MKRRFYRLGTPEAAQKRLLRWVKEGKITVEDIDKESPSSALLRQQAAKYYPEIELKPHVNLLRHDVLDQSNGIQKTKGVRKVAARSQPDF